MKNHTISAIAIAAGLVFGSATAAEMMTKDQHKARKDAIAAEYKTGKALCKTSEGNARDICEAKAKGREKVAVAELEAAYKPSDKAQRDLRIAKADAELALAKEMCDDKKGNAKEVCVKEAKATHTAAKSSAKVAMTTTKANKTAHEETAEARAKAVEKKDDVRKDAAANQRDADYAVAAAKCEALAGDAKSRCITDAKVRYNKS